MPGSRRRDTAGAADAVLSAAEEATLDVVEVSQGVVSLFLLAPVVSGTDLDLPGDCMFIMDLRAAIRGEGPAEGAFLLYDGTRAVLSGRAVSAARQESGLEVRFGDLDGPLAAAFGRQAELSLASEALSDASLAPGALSLSCRSSPATLRLVRGRGDAPPEVTSGQSALASLAALLGLGPQEGAAEPDVDPGVGDLARMLFPRYFLAS